MGAFDPSILLGVARVTDQDADAQGATEAEHRRGKVTALRSPHPAWIAVQPDPVGQAMLLEGLGQRRHERSRP